ncbi:MAG TPA: cystathionine beta-synthase, partial [Candidatus Dormibacteraeota bacterium]|nr:cystathionine beta-synthase [Candidatus Dormibacteraeota bacterium]
MDYRESILDAMGGTPLIRLNRVVAGLRPTILAKLETLNPGGSIKDRIGLSMIEDAERNGRLRPGGTIVEPTSGNTGHGLAIAAAIKGYRCVFVMPDKMSAEKISLLKAYGAEVVITPTAVDKDSPLSYYSVADRLTREIPGAYQPNQYANPRNPEAHYRTTGPEIWRQTEGRIDVFVSGMGTGGTISGCGRFLKEQKPSVMVVGADPEGSIYSGDVHPYKVEGIGEDFYPATMDLSLVDRIVRVTDKESFVAARRLAREEGILVGSSSGSALQATMAVAAELPESTVIVVVFPDTGRNYLSKFFSDEWMRENGFLERMAPARVREVVAAASGGVVPGLVTVAAGQTVGEAIDLMQRYSISQLPVVEDGAGPAPGDPTNPDSWGRIVGSIQERSLLDRIYRDPQVVSATVGTAMEPSFPQVPADAPVEEAFAALLKGEVAVLGVDGEAPLG